MKLYTDRIQNAFAFLLILPFVFISLNAFTQETQQDKDAAKAENAKNLKNIRDLNSKCLKCHSQSKYKMHNPNTDLDVYKKMPAERVINVDMYYNSNHRNFKCIDCHSEDFNTFPHAADLLFEEQYKCMDCHGDDPKYEKYNFAGIEKEYQESVHAVRLGDQSSCWMCHSPHYYKTTAGATQDISEIVRYDNEVCLSCHTNKERFGLLTDKTRPNILEKHEWLPNQELHFKSFRCVECHTKVNDSLAVSHNIVDRTKALKNCKECHTKNSYLITSLYKYQIEENRKRYGFFNPVMLEDIYVIGANRNYYFNIASVSLLVIVFGGISIHTILRFLIKKKTK
jgi:Zn finger protein HypA/HybF involved in hydrogenase expression